MFAEITWTPRGEQVRPEIRGLNPLNGGGNTVDGLILANARNSQAQLPARLPRARVLLPRLFTLPPPFCATAWNASVFHPHHRASNRWNWRRLLGGLTILAARRSGFDGAALGASGDSETPAHGGPQAYSRTSEPLPANRCAGARIRPNLLHLPECPT